MNSSHRFDIRQRPGLVEKALRWRIEAEHQFELAAGNGRHPVRFHALRRLRPEIDVHRPVGILLDIGCIGGAAGAIGPLQKRVRLSVVDGDRPILLYRHIGRHMQLVGAGAVIALAGLVLDVDQVELADAKALDRDIGVGIGDAARIHGIFVRFGISGGLT